MADLLTPLALLALGAYALFHDDKGKVGPQSSLDPEALDLATEMRTLPDGTQARYFRPDVASAIMTMLAGKSLEPVTVEGGAPGMVFKVCPLLGLTAQQAALAANAEGFAVFGSLSLPVTSDDSDKILMFASPSQRSAIAGAHSKLAIILDAGAGAVVSPGGPKGGAPFDVGMPPEIVAEVNAALSDPDADPDALDAMATELEGNGFPVAAASLRKRAQTIRLQDKLKGGVPFLIRSTDQGNASDLPYNVAQHYTGDGARWKEIVPANPGMIITNSQWGLIPSPWKPGSTILLPLSWNPRHVVKTKGLPHPVKEPSKKSQKAAEAVADEPSGIDDYIKAHGGVPAGSQVAKATAPEPEPTAEDRARAAAAIDEQENQPGAAHRSAAAKAAAIEERARAEAFLRQTREKSGTRVAGSRRKSNGVAGRAK